MQGKAPYTIMKPINVYIYAVSLPVKAFITKTSLFKYTPNFTNKKWKFSDKNSDTAHISAQNIDCEYSLEPPRQGGSNEYYNLCFEQK